MSNERLTVLKGGMLRYKYECSPEVGFDFNMLCEVGEPYQAWFRKEIQDRGLVVEYGRDIDYYPWCADFAVGRVP